jgi:hypothetical protein
MALTAWRRSSAREARGDDLPYGLDLDRAVAPGGLDSFLIDLPVRAFNPPADRQGGEHDREVAFGQVGLAVADGRPCRPVLDVRKLFSTFQRSWQLPVTKPRYELKAAAFATTRNALPQRPVRYTSVDTATQRSTARQGDTWRDSEKRPVSRENSQPAGSFRRWWQVVAGVGFEPTQAEPTVFRPLSLPKSQAADQRICTARRGPGCPLPRL